MATPKDLLEAASLRIDGVLREIEDLMTHPRRPPTDPVRTELQGHVGELRATQRGLRDIESRINEGSAS
jgi:hypothetical protein